MMMMTRGDGDDDDDDDEQGGGGGAEREQTASTSLTQIITHRGVVIIINIIVIIIIIIINIGDFPIIGIGGPHHLYIKPKDEITHFITTQCCLCSYSQCSLGKPSSTKSDDFLHIV